MLIDDYVASLNRFEAKRLDINDSAYPPQEVTRLIKEAPICPTYWYVQKVLISERLQNAYINPLGGYYLHYVYIDKGGK